MNMLPTFKDRGRNVEGKEIPPRAILVIVEEGKVYVTDNERRRKTIPSRDVAKGDVDRRILALLGLVIITPAMPAKLPKILKIGDHDHQLYILRAEGKMVFNKPKLCSFATFEELAEQGTMSRVAKFVAAHRAAVEAAIATAPLLQVPTT